jgi:hypothetical protein
MDQLTASIPTIVFAVKDGAGRELSAVKVTMDGEVVADHLDGSSLTLDPGSHQFTFETAGQPPLTETLIVHEGEKDRRESLTVGSPSAPAVPPTAATPTAAPSSFSATATPPDDSRHARRVLGVVVGSVGLVGLAVGSVFGGLDFSSWGNANRECPDHKGCSSQATSDRSNALVFGNVSTVSFIAGGVLLAGGLSLYFTAPNDQVSPSVGIQVAPGRLDLTGSF